MSVQLLKLVVIAACISPLTGMASSENEEHDPAEVTIGERLFLETRFAQAYYANPGKADPVLQHTETMGKPLRGPFTGKTMNCRACHMVDEHVDAPGAGMRTYADFTSNSPIPQRKDGAKRTPRNSMSLVNINVAGKHGVLFHFDGEFNSMEDLVRGTLSGRNYGWLAGESAQAIKHVANIIRFDDGKDDLGQEFGGSYTRILKATDKAIPAELRLPAEFRLDVARASDKQVFDVVAKLISVYVNDLSFAQDEQGNYVGSPYDHFLKLNGLPQQLAKGEPADQYADRLLNTVKQLKSPKFVTGKSKSFESHQQEFSFGKQELEGMKLFFSRGRKQAKGGNCVSCHSAPHFSDYSFHNTGLTQTKYDEVHGSGKFASLDIPGLVTRNKNHDKYLPASARHPKASGKFRAAIDKNKPGYTDLGLWNVFANPDMPAPQEKLRKLLCEQAGKKNCSDESLLPLTVAAFKTPVLRDLGHSSPYTHTGQFNSLHEVVILYVANSMLARGGQIRYVDQEMLDMNITFDDVAPLTAFLKSLNEDYD